MGAARVMVSFELLREVLHLPATTEIWFVGTADRDIAEITVADPGLQDVTLREGEKPPVVTPTFRRNVPVEFVEWGQR